MSNNTLVYSGSIPNGVSYEIHQETSMSGNTDIGFKVNGEFAVVITAGRQRRTGSIEFDVRKIDKFIVKPSVKQNLQPSPQSTPPQQSPTLADVIPTA